MISKSCSDRRGFIYVGTMECREILEGNVYNSITCPICQSKILIHINSFPIPAVGRELLTQNSGSRPLGAQSSIRGHRNGGPPLRMAESIRARRKFLFASSEPQSHTRAHPIESIGGVRNPERGHQDDVNHRRCKALPLVDRKAYPVYKEHFWYRSGNGWEGFFLPGREPGNIGISIMLSRAATSKRFSCLMHFPEPGDEFASHGDFSLSFISSMFEDTCIYSHISRVGTNQTESRFTESPPKSFWTRGRDVSLGSTSGRFPGSFSEAGITGNSLSIMEAIEPSDFSNNNGRDDICDTRNGLNEVNIIFELRQRRELENLPSDRELLEFEMFYGNQELGESKSRSCIQKMPLAKEPASCRVTGNIHGTWEVMLVEDPSHTYFDIGDDFRDGTPMPADFTELSGIFIRDTKR